MLSIWIKIKTLNLFDTDSDNPLVVNRQRQTTRLFIILITILLLVLIPYTALRETMNTYIINHPSQSEYESLEAKYADTLACPCNQTIISYHDIASVDLTPHPICSSGFVSPLFIAQLFGFNDTELYANDFSAISRQYFVHIAFLCQLARGFVSQDGSTVLNAWFFIDKAAHPDQVQAQANSLIQRQKQAVHSFMRQAMGMLLNLMVVTYALPFSYNSFTLPISSNGSIFIEPSGFSNCSCILDTDTCHTDGGFYDYNSLNNSYTLLSTVKGIRVGCTPFHSTMMSTLECFYSSECYDMVIHHWQIRNNNLFSAPSLLTRLFADDFNESSSINSIWESAFVSNWSINVPYATFFSACAPDYCTYSIYGRQNIIIIVTTIISIFSGASTVLKLLTPVLVQFFYWLLNDVRENFNLLHQVRGLMNKLRSLNLYFNRHKSSTITLRSELLSTRIFLVLWSVTFAVLILYNYLSPETITVVVERPNETTYEQIEMNFKSSLQCPCSQHSFSYSSFIEIASQFHQICYSPFIETGWINSIFAGGNWSNIAPNQFVGRGVAYFLVQKYLCNEMQILNEGVLQLLLSTQIQEGNILPKDQLVLQVNAQLDYSKKLIGMNSDLGVFGVRAETQINQFINIFSTSWIYSLNNYTQTSYSQIPTKPVSHGQNCSCATSSTCTEPIFVDNEIVAGFVLGCTPLESLLHSSFVCLYNQTCLNLINVGNYSFIKTLNSSIFSKFQPNTTVEEMIKSAFIEQILVNISYSDYFSACQSLSCTYLMSISKSALQLTSIILGLYGGLTLILFSISPWLSAIIFKLANTIHQIDNIVHPFI